MKKLCILLLLSGALYADSTTCSAGGPFNDSLTPVPCNSLIGVYIAPDGTSSLAVSAGTVDGGTSLGIGGGGYGTVIPNFERVDFSVNDTFVIPKAPVGDVFRISATGTTGQEGGGDGYGFNLTSVGLTAGTFSYTPPFGDCYADSCLVTTTVPAGQIKTLTLYGSASFLIGPNFSNSMSLGGGYNENITLQLFKADGVTPDVFTPEPASLTLVSMAFLAALGFCILKNRLHQTV